MMAGKRLGSLITFLLWCTLPCMIFSGVALASVVVMPPNVLYYVPITLTNSQSAPTNANLQVMLSFNALAYQTYENANLINVEFFNITSGNVIPSWLEGNYYNESQISNLYTDTDVIYWINLPDTIAASGTDNNIAVGFAPTGNNLLSATGYTGEAPQLSNSLTNPSGYGDYDNGNIVFLEYFNGQSPASAWNVRTGYSMASGVLQTYGPLTINTLEFTGAGCRCEQAVANSIAFPNEPLVVESSVITGIYDNGAAGLTNATLGGAVSNTIGADTSASSGQCNWGSYISQGNGGSGLDTGKQGTCNYWKFVSLVYPGSSAASWNAITSNYINTPSSGLTSTSTFSSTVPGIQTNSNLYMALIGQSNSAAPSTYFNWIRARLYPPGGVMPTATYGQITLGPQQPKSVPANIVDYVPIQLENYQAQQVNANVPLMVNVTALTYSQYYTCNMNNAEFFYSNGVTVDSWLEGNALNEEFANSLCTSAGSPNALVDSAKAIYWVDGVYLPSGSASIPGTNMIYLGFAGNTINSANTLLNSVNTGEAPQIGCPNPYVTAGCATYGAYDDGNVVFNFYDNFAGTSLSSAWQDYGSSITTYVNNGLLIMDSVGGWYGVNTVSYRAPTNVVIDTYFNSNTAGQYGGVGLGVSPTGNAQHPTFELRYQGSGQWGIEQYQCPCVYSGSAHPGIWYLMSGYANTAGQTTLTTNYTNVQVSGTGYTQYVPGQSLSIVDLSSGEYVTFQWIRTRYNPPASTFPSAVFGSTVSAVHPAATVTNALLDAGQYETVAATVSGGVPPYTYNILVSNSVSEGVITHNGLFTEVSSSMQSFTFQATSADVSNSPEAANVNVTDSDGTTSNALSPTFVVNPAMSTPTIQISAASSPGGPETFNSYVSGGTSPLTYNFMIYNAISNALLASYQVSNNGVAVPSTFLGGLSIYANVIVTDSASTHAMANSIESAVTAVNPVPLPSAIPANIMTYVPVVLTDNQSSAVSTDVPLMVNVKASQYNEYTCSLNNAEFFFSNGVAINSWLEGNVLNEFAANSLCASAASPNALAASANVVYWISGVYVPSGGSNTVYLGWTGNVIGSANTLMDGTQTGEAPQLSCSNPYSTSTCNGIYGQYDNGNVVFQFYDNFAGDLPINTVGQNWINAGVGTIQVTNGITLGVANTPSDANELYSRSTFGQGVVDFYGHIPVLSSGANYGQNVGLMGVNEKTNAADIISGWFSTSGLATTTSGGVHNVVSGLEFGVNAVYSVIVPSSSPSYISAQINYGGTITSSSDLPTLPQGIGFMNALNSAANLGPVIWIRQRNYPPNGIMPSASFGQVNYALSASISPSSAQAYDIGQTVTFNAVATGGSGSYTYNFVVYNSITNSVITSTGPTSTNGFQYNAVSTGQIDANALIKDTYTSVTANSALSGVISINSRPSVYLYVSNAVLESGQYETYTFAVSGGTGPFVVQLYNITGSGNAGQNVIVTAPGGSNSITIQAGNVGTFVYNAIATDEGTAVPFIFNSVSNSIVVSSSNTTTTTIPCINGCYRGSGGTGTYGTTVPTTSAAPTTTAPETTTASTTTIAATTSTTTTIIQVITVQPPPSSANSTVVVVSMNASSSSPAVVNFTNSNATLRVFPTSESKAVINITIEDIGPYIMTPAGVYTVSAINVSSQQGISEIEADLRYPCSVPANSIAPYTPVNGTWQKMDNYTVNAAGCTVQVRKQGTGVIALFSNSPAAAPGLSAETVALAAMAIVIVGLAAYVIKLKLARRNRIGS